MRIHDPDVQAWLKRLRRVLAQCPAGVALIGMDTDLLVVDLETLGDSTPAEVGWTGDHDWCLNVGTGREYLDSCGW